MPVLLHIFIYLLVIGGLGGIILSGAMYYLKGNHKRKMYYDIDKDKNENTS